jgi:hypothetical protein
VRSFVRHHVELFNEWPQEWHEHNGERSQADEYSLAARQWRLGSRYWRLRRIHATSLRDPGQYGNPYFGGNSRNLRIVRYTEYRMVGAVPRRFGTSLDAWRHPHAE